MTTETNGSTRWIRKNALQLLTLLAIVFGFAVAYGSAQADIGTTSDRVLRLRADTDTATAERSIMKSDLRVVETKQDALGDTVRDAVTAIDRLERVVSRLEAVARVLGRPPTRSIP